MKTKIGMSLGLALTLVVGVFATMLALGLFTPAPAQAAISDVTVTTNPTTQNSPTTVTAVFTTATAVPDGGSIVIEFSSSPAMQLARIHKPLRPKHLSRLK